MIKFHELAAGMNLLDIRKVKIGNSTMREWGLWQVKIIEVYQDVRAALVSWNGNKPEKWYEHRLRRLHVKQTKAYREQQERRANGWRS